VNTLGLTSAPVATGQPNLLAKAEEQLGVPLPASIREWYGEVDGRYVLSKYSNRDWALSPHEFKLVNVNGKPLVIIMHENQGVCWWGFELDSSDDPPVYCNLDPPPDKLFLYASTFSEFTYVRVFDFDGFCDDDRFLMEIREPLSHADVHWLETNFTVEPRSSGWPSTVTYRFSSTHGRVTIWQSDRQADWNLSASSANALDQLKRSVSPLWRNDD
jgi:hypothetical protein